MGHGLSGDELGRPPPGLQLARRARVRASVRGPRLSLRRARPTWWSTAHQAVLLSTIAGSPCTCNARGRAWRMPRSAAAPVDCAAAQPPLVSCGGAPAASRSSPERGRRRVFRPFHLELQRSETWPNGMGNQKKRKSATPIELRVDTPSGYDKVNVIWSSRGRPVSSPRA